MANTYDAGETVVLQATFKNTGGTLSTPDSQVLYIERPDGTTSTHGTISLTNPSTGVVQYVDTASGHGITWYRFVGETNGITVTEQDYYNVRKQYAPGTLLALAEPPVFPQFHVAISTPTGDSSTIIAARSLEHAREIGEAMAQKIADTAAEQAGVVDEVGRTIHRKAVTVTDVRPVA